MPIAPGRIEIPLDGTFNQIRIALSKTGEAEFTADDISSVKACVNYGLIDYLNVSEQKTTWTTFGGRKMAALGDSLTAGYIPRNTTGYPGTLRSFARIAADELGMSFENHGIVGSTMANVPDKNPMSQRYQNLPNDADIILVMGGTNDVRNGVQLGTMADRTDATYYGALHVVLGGLYKKYFIDQTPAEGKKKRIIAIAPIKLLGASAPAIGGTGTLVDMNAWVAAVKEVAAYYSIGFLDFYNESGINPHLNQTVQGTEPGYTGFYNPYITDGTHPTQEGHQLMADVLIGYIKGQR